MNQHQYRLQEKLTLQQFADLIAVPNARTVHRYESGGVDQRIPARQIMERIRTATNGSVRANDYYEARPEAA